MLPPICDSKVRVEKLNIEYMTYFDDMRNYNRLTDRLYQTRVMNETHTQLLRLQEALVGQRIGHQGFGGDYL